MSVRHGSLRAAFFNHCYYRGFAKQWLKQTHFSISYASARAVSLMRCSRVHTVPYYSGERKALYIILEMNGCLSDKFNVIVYGK